MDDERRNTNKTAQRFAELARMGEVVFHSDDLANLWAITNKNTLYTTVKRYTDTKLLFRLGNAFYSIRKPREIDPQLLGIKALHGYAYVSTETVLRESGIIQQEPAYITIISSVTKRYIVAGHNYFSRRLPDRFLYHSVDISISPGGVRKASVERAVADLLYFNKRAYFDAGEQIDWDKVRAVQTTVGYPLTANRYD